MTRHVRPTGPRRSWRRATLATAAALAAVVASSAPASAQWVPEPATGPLLDYRSFAISPPTAGQVLPGGWRGPAQREWPLVLWDEGVATARTVLTESARRLSVALRGDPCDGALPRAVISVDGVEVADVRIGSSWHLMTSTVGGWFPAGPHEVSVRAVGIRPGCGTVKVLNAVFGREPAREAPGVAWLYGTDYRTDPPGIGGVFRHGWLGEPALVLWSTGSAVAYPWTKGVESVWVRARGDSCEGDARMVVRVDGHLVIDTEVTEQSRLYRAEGLADVRPWPDGTHTVAVHFPNDHRTDDCDRNLKVEWLVLRGSR